MLGRSLCYVKAGPFSQHANNFTPISIVFMTSLPANLLPNNNLSSNNQLALNAAACQAGLIGALLQAWYRYFHKTS